MGMMNLGGSLRYDMHGRKRKAYKKNNPTVKKRRHTTVTQELKPKNNAVLEAYKEHQRKYPSLGMSTKNAGKGTKNVSWDMEKQEISKGYTVAPAYNKGAYQVIGKANVKDIGK
tara:strand:- start:1757 stop:2098 length:342 start_codon:yes stop_codon:yes gene_type:complete